MATLKLSFSIFLLFFLQASANAQTCGSYAKCDLAIIQFPFRLPDQPACCGDPNFNIISCKNQSRRGEVSTINFPFSGEFEVNVIGYSEPTLMISDQDNCIAKRLLEGLNLSGTPFVPAYPETYHFFNCSFDVPVEPPAILFSCLSGSNFTVVATPEVFYNQSSPFQLCRYIASIPVPVPVPFQTTYYPNFLDQLMLTWPQDPDCSSSCSNFCENRRRGCENAYEFCYPKKKGLSKGTKYALSFGLGLPIFLLLVVIMLHRKSRRTVVDHQGRRINGGLEISRLPEPQSATTNGLQSSRIEAYPITVLGESFKLSRPNDNTCSICLSEYKTKETIRTITECEHYFHSKCIDEWLKLNATCPVCRNSPDRETALINRSTFTLPP